MQHDCNGPIVLYQSSQNMACAGGQQTPNCLSVVNDLRTVAKQAVEALV
jgi:hypothetical protein